MQPLVIELQNQISKLQAQADSKLYSIRQQRLVLSKLQREVKDKHFKMKQKELLNKFKEAQKVRIWL